MLIFFFFFRLCCCCCSDEIRELRKELTKREEKITSEIVKTCNIILATNVGAADRCLTNEKFDVVVIDEAAQGEYFLRSFFPLSILTPSRGSTRGKLLDTHSERKESGAGWRSFNAFFFFSFFSFSIQHHHLQIIANCLPPSNLMKLKRKALDLPCLRDFPKSSLKL
jgi:hypothetical protein